MSVDEVLEDLIAYAPTLAGITKDASQETLSKDIRKSYSLEKNTNVNEMGEISNFETLLSCIPFAWFIL